MSSEIEVSSIDTSRHDQLSGNQYPNLFSSPKWINVLKSEYDYRFLKIGVPDSNNFLVVAQFNQFGISKVKGLPFCDYMIPSVTDAKTLNRLINHLNKHFSDIPVELKMVLPAKIGPNQLEYPLKHTAYRHIVDTSASMQRIKDNMDNSFIRGVRKAESFDLKVSITQGKEALDRFYDVYCKQRVEKFKKLPQPYSFFETICENFMSDDRGFILQAKKGKTVIASMMILAHHQTMYYKFGCSLPNYLNYRPNNQLFYRLFEHAHEHGFKQVDLGLSGVSKSYKGLVRFKEYMGGVADNIYSLRIEPAAYDATAESELQTFTSALTEKIVAKSPDKKTANAYSEILYPYFV